MKYCLCLFVILLCFINIGQSQQCRNGRGWRVDWWVKLSFPNSVSTGYAYYDSRYASPTMSIEKQQPDADGSPLRRTLQQIEKYTMEVVAWNDAHPDGRYSGTRAHSKSISAYDTQTEGGFMIIHSMPEWPKFNGTIIDPMIDDSQQKYGQHIMCISADKLYMTTMINKILPIYPFQYTMNYNCGQILRQVLHSSVTPPDYQNKFSYWNYTRNGSEINMIFKNGRKNSSIFEDGLNNMLQSPILSQTWGRPLQDTWCGSQYSTGNILQISASSNITWRTTQDHSKWAIATNVNYSCFGDMNRMTSQWDRGGAFYCIKSTNLNSALKAIIKSSEQCTSAGP